MKGKAILISAIAIVSTGVTAGPNTSLPQVPSQVSRTQFHASRFGLMTTTSFGLYGEQTIHTQPIDFDTYFASSGTKLVVGAAAVRNIVSAAQGINCTDPTVDEICSGDDGGGGLDTGGGGGTGGSSNPGGSGPGSAPPDPPPPPADNSVPWDVGVVSYTQYYDNGNYQQTTTYSRNVYQSNQSDGPWGAPLVNDAPVKK